MIYRIPFQCFRSRPASREAQSEPRTLAHDAARCQWGAPPGGLRRSLLSALPPVLPPVLPPIRAYLHRDEMCTRRSALDPLLEILARSYSDDADLSSRIREVFEVAKKRAPARSWCAQIRCNKPKTKMNYGCGVGGTNAPFFASARASKEESPCQGVSCRVCSGRRTMCHSKSWGLERMGEGMRQVRACVP